MKNLLYLNKYLWKYRGRLSMGALFIILANVFNVYAPALVGDGIDFLAESLKAKSTLTDVHTQQMIEAPNSFKNAASIFGMEAQPIILTQINFIAEVTRIAILLALGYLGFYILKGVFLFFQRQTIIVMSRHIEYDLKNEIYDQYQKLDMAFYRKNRTGDLMNRISEDVNRVRMYLGPAIMYTINLIVLVIMCVVVMLKIDVELTLYTLSPLPFMMIGIFYVSTIIHRRTDYVQKQQSTLSTMVQESMSGIRVLKSFGREKYFTETFTAESDEYKARQLRLVKADALFMPVIVVLVGMSTILTVYVGANKVIEGTLTYGVIVQFVFYVNQLTWPFASVGWVSSLVQKAEASQARINEFLNSTPTIQHDPTAKAMERGSIAFNNVSFTYEESGIEALRNVSFEIQQGQTLGIVGRTGSGKSTIANLILRLYDPQSGSVTINGHALPEYDLYALRRSIGYVPQDVFLFSDSIKNNIAFSADTPEDKNVEDAAIKADIHHNINSFPKGYDTILGERGINISGGQKQRVSIARAIIKNPDILIFDDCLSAVDTQTEEHILKALEDVMQNKTSIIISHRISSLKNADKIIVIDEGRIIETGTHQSLIEQHGFYASLHKRQLLKGQVD
jgi:ATP-binding cassette subfamily B protein